MSLSESIIRNLTEDVEDGTLEYRLLDKNKKIIDRIYEEIDWYDTNDQDIESAWPGLLKLISKIEEDKDGIYKDVQYIIADNANDETMLLWTPDEGITEEYFDNQFIY